MIVEIVSEGLDVGDAVFALLPCEMSWKENYRQSVSVCVVGSYFVPNVT